jgi:intein/homing endonuclease
MANFSKEFIKDYIINNYDKKLVKDIQSFLGVSFWTIKKVLTNNNITLKGSGTTSLLNEELVTPFKSELTDYVLGLLASDGQIVYNEKTRQYIVKYASKDIELIEIFQKHFGKVSMVERNDGVVIAYFGSKKLCKKLIEIGIVPNKSKIINYKLINRHFLRGYFDGDGSVRFNRIELHIASSSLIMLENLKEFLLLNGINSAIRKKSNKEEFYGIFISNKKDFTNFYNLVYKDSNYYLKRKYNRFVALLSNEKI